MDIAASGKLRWACVFSIGDKIIYSENGVYTVEKIAPLEPSGRPAGGRLYYYLSPLVGSGILYVPVDSDAFMRHVMSREEAEALIDSIPGIEPAICDDSRFNHVDAYYRDLFKLHSCETLVSIVKGIRHRSVGRKTRSIRSEATMRRAKDILNGELSVALDMDIEEVESYVISRIGGG